MIIGIVIIVYCAIRFPSDVVGPLFTEEGQHPTWTLMVDTYNDLSSHSGAQEI